MPKKRRYGEAWKDVQIDAEQSDAVFERFFRQTPPPTTPEVSTSSPASLEDSMGRQPEKIVPVEPNSLILKEVTPESKTTKPKTTRPTDAKKKLQDVPADTERNTDGQAKIAQPDVRALRRQLILSKGEAAILCYLVRQVEAKAKKPECYVKIPLIAEACDLSHRGCQLALKSLQARGLVVKIKEYDPTNRLGMKFLIQLPSS